TDGTITPADALSQASQILVDHFSVVAGKTAPAQQAPVVSDRADQGAAKIMIEEVNLSPRTTNALLNNDIKTMKDLLRLSDGELKDLKGFGAKAYDEVKDKIT